MKNHFYTKAMALLLGGATVFLGACNKPTPPPTPTPDEDPDLAAACRYIQGGASSATGGEGGNIYFVSTLEDAFDPGTKLPEMGTLRYACMQSGVRTILFEVAGTIHLKSPLEITKGHLTIAGQSAPGDGICIADYPLIIKGADNVIVRFIRVRLGNESLKKNPEQDYDAISVNDCHNVVLDHVSASWSVDECLSCYGNTDFTMQYCFITESLRNAGHVKGAHGYGGIWGGQNATFHHNLLAHHDSRNPRFDHDYVNTLSGPIDYINNVVYNWGGNSTYGGEGNKGSGGGRKINFISNYYKAGPSTKSGVKYRLCNPTTRCSNCGGTIEPMKMYLTDNYMSGNDAVTQDNWSGVQPDDASLLPSTRADARYTFPNAYTGEQTAQQAYETVINKAGCSLVRDAVDNRIVADVQQGTGKLIDKPSDVGGWPTLQGVPQKDTDGDGIPDVWEEAHGLNPKSLRDGSEHTLVKAHTNLEAYLCDIVKHLY